MSEREQSLHEMNAINPRSQLPINFFGFNPKFKKKLRKKKGQIL